MKFYIGAVVHWWERSLMWVHVNAGTMTNSAGLQSADSAAAGGRHCVMTHPNDFDLKVNIINII